MSANDPTYRIDFQGANPPDDATLDLTRAIRNMLTRSGDASAPLITSAVDPLGQDERIGAQFILTSPFGVHRITIIPEATEVEGSE